MYLIVGPPAVLPVTNPVESTVAKAVLLLLHTPPFVVSVNFAVLPIHKSVTVPIIADTFAAPLTVITKSVSLLHPLLFVTVYLIESIPGATPVTNPPPPPGPPPPFVTTAIAVFKLVHVPPFVASASCEVFPTQTLALPVIAFIVGMAYTVTPLVTAVLQEVPFVTV